MKPTPHLSLENECLSLGVLPQVGGSISFFRAKMPDGHWVDIMRPTTTKGVKDKDPLSVGSFPLFPISNRIENARFTANGKTYRFKPNLPPEPHINHGDSWYKPWRVDEATPFKIKISHDTSLSNFPIKYRASQTFTLSGRKMTVALSLQNCHTERMPFGFGLHPYFPVTKKAFITTENPNVWITGKNAIPCRHIPTPKKWSMSAGLQVAKATMDNCFTGGKGHVRITWPEHKCAVEMTAERPMHNLVVYIPSHHKFFCAELVSNATAALNRLHAPHPEDNLIWLKPQGSIAAKQEFTVIPL